MELMQFPPEIITNIVRIFCVRDPHNRAEYIYDLRATCKQLYDIVEKLVTTTHLNRKIELTHGDAGNSLTITNGITTNLHRILTDFTYKITVVTYPGESTLCDVVYHRCWYCKHYSIYLPTYYRIYEKGINLVLREISCCGGCINNYILGANRSISHNEIIDFVIEKSYKMRYDACILVDNWEIVTQRRKIIFE